jgi:protein O-GlcNAc transferase
MASKNIEKLLQLASDYVQAGRFAEAEPLYRHVLDLDPKQAAALQNLGILVFQKGDASGAAQLFRAAIAVNPGNANSYVTLGVALRRLGKFAEAEEALRAGLRVDPNGVNLHYMLGMTLRELSRSGEAVGPLQTAVGLKPDHADAWVRLGMAFRESGRLGEGIGAMERAAALAPNSPEIQNLLGEMFSERGELGRAESAFRAAVALKGDYCDALVNLANVLHDMRRLEESVSTYRRAILISPQSFEAHSNFGNTLSDMGRLDEAIGVHRRAIEIAPQRFEGHSNLGNTLREQGLLEEAVAAYRTALQLRPSPHSHSNLLYTLLFHPNLDPAALLEEHVQWARQHAAPLASGIESPRTTHTGEGGASSERRLRIGYVSPDFREHPVGRFLLPLLSAHDHKRFEIVCYSDVLVPDEVTRELRSYADQWTSTLGMSDEALAQRIRADEIDILVDLALHLAGNRMLVFARKPAPVQITYLAYAGTSGLATMDYRITDRYLDPPGSNDEYYVEKSLRLEDSYWCYRPIPRTPAVGPLPVSSTGFVTFGCLNHFSKINAGVLNTWAEILSRVPRSRILIYSKPGSHLDRVRSIFESHGVSADRVQTVGRQPIGDYLQTYNRIDIALDPFPYNGGTTSCDALWMGVPVVTLAGKLAVARAGVSVLSNVSLTELIAGSLQEYIAKAVELAGDVPRLAQLRSTLRERLQGSPLMDVKKFTEQMESAYVAAWRGVR